MSIGVSYCSVEQCMKCSAERLHLLLLDSYDSLHLNSGITSLNVRVGLREHDVCYSAGPDRVVTWSFVFRMPCGDHHPWLKVWTPHEESS